jgi:hypothetical protein
VFASDRVWHERQAGLKLLHEHRNLTLIEDRVPIGIDEPKADRVRPLGGPDVPREHVPKILHKAQILLNLIPPANIYSHMRLVPKVQVLRELTPATKVLVRDGRHALRRRVSRVPCRVEVMVKVLNGYPKFTIVVRGIRFYLADGLLKLLGGFP